LLKIGIFAILKRMKFFLFSLFLALGSPLGAMTFYKAEKAFYVIDESCNSTLKTKTDLAQWMRSIDPQSQCETKEPIENKFTKKCLLEISQCVPAHVLKYQSIEPQFSGPNCWNLALVLKGILPHLRYTSPEEMGFYMQPPLCRQLSPGEKRESGDVGLVRFKSEDKLEERHGFIYVSENLTYSKNGFKKEAPYEIQDIQGVFDLYGVPNKKECRSNQTSTSKKCPASTAYFRCISFEEYLQKNPEVPQQIIKALNDVTAYEGCLEARNFGPGDFLEPLPLETITDSLKVLAAYVDQEKQQTDVEKFLLGDLQFRLASISKQLKFMDEGNELKEISPLRSLFTGSP
jgi:hypothetical protein